MTELQKAYKMVVDDIFNDGPDMFTGLYDAENGSHAFMFGIETMIEYMGYKVSDEYGEAKSNEFIANIIRSKERVGCYDD